MSERDDSDNESLTSVMSLLKGGSSDCLDVLLISDEDDVAMIEANVHEVSEPDRDLEHLAEVGCRNIHSAMF
jgi:hypothetical protein